ncbi:MAG: DUF177 domain-containing protein [Bacilli bacterium]|nr:DUF177 domain-containing protein [Bacilli bacterium]
MKINRALLSFGNSKTFTESIDFSSLTFDGSHIRKIESCEATVIATDYDDILRIEVKIDAKVIGICAYTLEDVELSIKAEDELTFSDDENDQDSYYEKSNIIDLDEYILGILLANVPVRIIKKGAKLPQNGKNYRVMSEDEYEKEKEKKHDPRFDILDTVEFDED